MRTALRLTVSVSFLTASILSAATHYVSLGSANSTPPYTNWITAATTIQDAVDASLSGDEIVVTNGLYASGGRAVDGTLTNRVALVRPLVLRSVMGPQFTLIEGSSNPPVRCVYLTNAACLFGFTLKNGYIAPTYGSRPDSLHSGGGAFSAGGQTLISNCVFVGNQSGYGGGAHGATLLNCTLAGNWASSAGGGASYCTLTNCALTTNSAYAFGGGAFMGTLSHCTLTGNVVGRSNGGPWNGGGAAGDITLPGNGFVYLYNCLVIGNSAPLGDGGGVSMGWLQNCTVISNSAATYGGGVSGEDELAPPGTVGSLSSYAYNCIIYGNSAWAGDVSFCHLTSCFTDNPLFVDPAAGNFRLQPDSPCIDAGSNAYGAEATDRDGRPRIVGGTVDIGAYEFQPGVSGVFIGWLQQNGLPTDGSADYADPDGDAMNNWQEWVCGTDPTNALSASAACDLPLLEIASPPPVP